MQTRMNLQVLGMLQHVSGKPLISNALNPLVAEPNGPQVKALGYTLFQISVNTTRQRRLVQHLGETLLLQ